MTILDTNENNLSLNVLQYNTPSRRSQQIQSTLVTTDVYPAEIKEKLDLILSNQNMFQEQQNMILQQLAKLEVILDKTVDTIDKQSCSCQPSQVRNTCGSTIMFKEITTLQELEDFEAKLSDKKNMDSFVGEFSKICGRGTGNGINNCYMLVDKIFSRKFMTLCSWAGGSRDQKEKIPFKLQEYCNFFL